MWRLYNLVHCIILWARKGTNKSFDTQSIWVSPVCVCVASRVGSIILWLLQVLHKWSQQRRCRRGQERRTLPTWHGKGSQALKQGLVYHCSLQKLNVLFKATKLTSNSKLCLRWCSALQQVKAPDNLRTSFEFWPYAKFKQKPILGLCNPISGSTFCFFLRVVIVFGLQINFKAAQVKQQS